jgi:hypothetical protein
VRFLWLSFCQVCSFIVKTKFHEILLNYENGKRLRSNPYPTTQILLLKVPLSTHVLPHVLSHPTTQILMLEVPLGSGVLLHVLPHFAIHIRILEIHYHIGSCVLPHVLTHSILGIQDESLSDFVS